MGKISGFLELLKEPLKIPSRNGKLMAITASSYFILCSISLILLFVSINPFILDLSLKIMSLVSARPGTPEYSQLLVAIRDDIGIFFGIEAAFMVLFYFIALFAQTAIIVIASCYYTDYDLSFKELILKVSKTWTRPLVTSIWVQLITAGYTCLFILPYMVASLLLFDHPTILKTVLIILAIVFFTLYIYLSVVWILGMVVSVIEDCYGFSALGKARDLVNGKRVHGFLLNLLAILVMLVIVAVGSKFSPAMPIVVGVIQTLLIVVIGMFQLMAYTGFYYQCKNGMTKSGGLEYSRVSTANVDEYLP
ncbi:hypothetical protein R6Q57_020380 [Mikania cordata]